ncbi:MAG: multidrug transporter AcrB [Ignavibacteria bacterium RIFOXYB2_FULL_35_12]|nr:MAG: multidrug transporter AcrB [Ignavibacteria bacterium GWA2_36_19]OGU61762.1 MAG: multidrug transporter AcrB [Ignavibacteria bacterium GWF2_35_20]OGU85845.1 MAG: multidrug transporter AcrB [Ignavibacteria bacterium RIFOXYA12_FULL_35_25]OGU89566.1 MAG: multidrug transporter AcrB [Ignavibacteria bacterium RIFOXYC12_FULL_35_11]OGU96498.1 MAG: multidrug transporter AcrB [Ignavibacteria bacterium RIFOXYB12_FULL_35_14]OGU98348.1 MAG: multidrug transporter AcrB [Ignavibacteria bacterium RIFOXYC
MKLSDISIRRPVFATVMSLAILLFGIISFTQLPVREYPDIDPPIISVVTIYRGASSNVVETEITDVLEEQFATLEGVKTITSSSREGGSVITIEFELNRDVNEAANDARDRVSRVRGALPQEIDDPIISKVDANAQAIVWLALSSQHHSGLELSDFADRVLKEKIQRLPGVGSVIIGGERRYAMRVWIDPLRLAAHGLTSQDIEAAVRSENAEIPGGRVEGVQREFAVRTRGELSKPEEFGSIIISQKGDAVIRLRDVADVNVGAEDERTLARWNSQLAVGLGIVKQSKASTVDVAAEIKKSLPELAKLLPEGMKLEVAFDSSEFINESISEVQQTLMIALVLVVLVVLAFLKSFRATIIPSLAIPISIIGALAAVYFAGFTINILTLLGFVLAIGLVVDDAIVVLENIYRHMEMGKSRWQASLDGSKEIGFAIISTTISLVAVFIPLAFLSGNVGRLFNEFGIAVAVAVLISGFVALTLTPMISSLILRPLHGTSKSWASRSFDAFFNWLNFIYESTLRWTLRHRLLLISGGVGVVILGVFLFNLLPSELVPVEDRGVSFGIVIAPEGATLEYTDRYVREIENLLLKLPELEGLFTATGLSFGGPGSVTNSFMFLNLKPRSERDKSQQQIVQELFAQLISIPGVLAFVINPPSLGANFGSSSVEYVLQADTYDELNKSMGLMMGEASKLGYLINMDSDLRLNKPQLDVDIDRERASHLGVSVTDIGSTLETLLGGRKVTDFKRGTKQYDVVLQMKPEYRSSPDAIQNIYIRSRGGLVQLANVVKVKTTVAPKELNHYNRIRSATLSANLAPGVTLGQALDDLDRIAQEKLPANIKHEYAGQSLEYKSSSSALYFMFILAIIFIYLVLSAQFESFIHPFTILLSVPLAVFGALLTLFIFGQSLNIYSQIGLIMLVGLVTKNSILIVEFANQQRAQGFSFIDAVVNAATIRLRPILMTSFATIFGILPIAIGLGAGAESRRPLGLAVVGGMLFSTFLTLVIIPIVYTLLARFTSPAKQELEQAENSTEIISGSVNLIPEGFTK